jgi:hypothetical protein
VARDTGDVDATRLKLDDEQDAVTDDAGEREHLDVEEVHGREGAEVGPDECLPGRALTPLGGRLETVVEKDALDGVAVALVAEIGERVAQPCVAPAWIVSRELDDQFLNRRRRRRPAGSTFGGAIVFCRDELAIPTQDGIRRHEAAKVAEHLAAERIATQCQAASLVIGEVQAPALELLAQNAVLLPEVIDDRELPAIDPTREQQEQKFKRPTLHGTPW